MQFYVKNQDCGFYFYHRAFEVASSALSMRNLIKEIIVKILTVHKMGLGEIITTSTESGNC